MKAHDHDPRRPREETYDSFDYCIDFWQGALDDEEEARRIVRQSRPRHVRAFDDVA